MHNLRCEHSTSDPKRCQCTECGGKKHGIQAPRLLYPELGADLKRAGQQLAAYNEAMFAESGMRV